MIVGESRLIDLPFRFRIACYWFVGQDLATYGGPVDALTGTLIILRFRFTTSCTIASTFHVALAGNGKVFG